MALVKRLWTFSIIFISVLKWGLLSTYQGLKVRGHEQGLEVRLEDEDKVKNL